VTRHGKGDLTSETRAVQCPAHGARSVPGEPESPERVALGALLVLALLGTAAVLALVAPSVMAMLQ
jgi:hypothetical protein